LTTTTVYDPRNRLVSSTTPNLETTTHVYDALMTSEHHRPRGITTTRSYLLPGVLRVWSTAGVQTFEYEFNDAVEVISLTDPRGSVTTYQNDVMGQADGHY